MGRTEEEEDDDDEDENGVMVCSQSLQLAVCKHRQECNATAARYTPGYDVWIGRLAPSQSSSG